MPGPPEEESFRIGWANEGTGLLSKLKAAAAPAPRAYSSSLSPVPPDA